MAPLPGKLIIGYTTRSHLLLDLDNTSLPKTRALTQQIMRQWPKVGDCLILESSKGSHRITILPQVSPDKMVHYNRDNFMLVFNNRIGYNLCCKIIDVLAGLELLNDDYKRIREFRGDLTLRVSPKFYSDRFIGSPTIVEYIHNEHTFQRDNMIGHFADYLRCYDNIINLRPLPFRFSLADDLGINMPE